MAISGKWGQAGEMGTGREKRKLGRENYRWASFPEARESLLEAQESFPKRRESLLKGWESLLEGQASFPRGWESLLEDLASSPRGRESPQSLANEFHRLLPAGEPHPCHLLP